MLVLRPEAMLRGGREVPLTMIEFRELFRKDPLGKMQAVVHSFRTDANDWYKGEKFATGAGEIKLGWSLVKKKGCQKCICKTQNWYRSRLR
ncbi:hypothetical protein HYU93_01355 [Candidatus Daviesbacteria bacterium]|nr:hypothetical protein [Candidatus Daviesbacteria bacterium]